MKFLDFDPNDDSNKMAIPNSSFTFSGVRFDKLGAMEYTLATIAMDVSGSIQPWEGKLLEMLNAIVDACKGKPTHPNPRAENILLRLITFNQTVREIHGFVPLINIQQYEQKDLQCDGATALYDATFSSVGASKVYAKSLIDQGYSVNNIMYIITDGADNRSVTMPPRIRKEIEETLHSEMFGTVTTILIGINSAGCRSELERFKNEANLTAYVDMGDVTAGKIAHLSGYVSKSVSSASQSLAAGAPVTVQKVTF